MGFKFNKKTFELFKNALKDFTEIENKFKKYNLKDYSEENFEELKKDFNPYNVEIDFENEMALVDFEHKNIIGTICFPYKKYFLNSRISFMDGDYESEEIDFIKEYVENFKERL